MRRRRLGNDLDARVTCGASATLELSVLVHPDGACLRVERGDVTFEALVDRGSGSFEIHPTHLDPDGELDVVVAFASMGCGLASAWRHVVVVASGPSGFSAWSFDSLGFGARSLQRHAGASGPVLVQSELAQATGRDRREHSWFMHSS